MTLQERLTQYLAKSPSIDSSAYIAKSAEIIGDVRIGPKASIWPQTVLRADINYIEVGEGTNIQDGVIIHLADDYPSIIGKDVTVGHGAIIHACTIQDECLIGMRATILDGAVIGSGSIVGAGAVVTQEAKIPPRSLVLGIPAKVVRETTDDELERISKSALKYQEMAQVYSQRR